MDHTQITGKIKVIFSSSSFEPRVNIITPSCQAYQTRFNHKNIVDKSMRVNFTLHDRD